MRIAMIASRYPYGGAEQVAMLLVRGLEKRHEVSFITTGEPRASVEEDGHRRVIIPLPRHRWFWHHYRNPSVVRRLREHLRILRPDVIHFHSIHNRTFSAAALLLSRDYPAVWSLHDVWSQCIWSKSRPPLCERMTSGCRWCPAFPGFSIVNRRIKEHYWERADIHVIHCSEWMKRFFAGSALGRKPSTVIPNGVEPERFSGRDGGKVRRSLGIPPDARVVLFVGNMLLPQKGHRELLRMAAGITAGEKDVWFVFVGHHAEPPQPKARIVLTGPVDPAEIPDHYAAADVFAFPSHVEYAPLVILEAMAAAVPLVTYGVGGIPEQVVDGETGILVEPGDEEAFETQLRRVLADGERRRAMGEAGRRRVERLFSLSRQVAGTEAVYEAVIARRRGGPACLSTPVEEHT